MYRITLLSLVFILFVCTFATGQWVKLENLEIKEESAELAGPRIVMEYNLNDKTISPDHPVYVFVRTSNDFGETWNLLSPKNLRGNGYGIVEKAGPRKIFWWGTGETSFPQFEQAEFKVLGIRMCRVPAGKFVMKSIPGQGRDEAKVQKPATELPEYYIAKNETTIGMYVDYLNEVGGEGMGWNRRMANPKRCGIEKLENCKYKVIEGRGTYPVNYVSWYDAVSFLQWCGLRLPSEAEFEKAVRGGKLLDGDNPGKKLNPNPERRYPWGNDDPNAAGVFRCNYDGADDGFEYTAPVGSFAKFNSPYGVCDLAGNISEWTLDWYTTSFHVGLDGFRLARGGSWMAVPVACDAITGATQFPLKESSIMGFRATCDSR
jgi:formylglycine-generating enzyme required for sulfatase activity